MESGNLKNNNITNDFVFVGTLLFHIVAVCGITPCVYLNYR